MKSIPELKKSLERFVDQHFKNPGKERPHIEIHANRERDDDLILYEALDELEALRKFAIEVNRIRNNIIGSQAPNFSRDIYPLVSALTAIGIDGEGYEQAKARLAADPKHGYLDT